MPDERGVGRGGRRDLGALIVRGAGWMLGSQAITQVVGLITSVLVARFLGPRAVGLAGMALVFSSLALVIVDFGFASALVQRAELSDEDASSAFWASLALGLLLTVVGVGASWPISALYGEPEVQKLFAVLSLTFLFTAPGIVQGALLTRQLRFRALQLRNIAALCASSVVAISFAAAGAGPWAIVAQDLTITSVSTLLLWRSSPWRPRLVVSRASLRSIAGFGGNVFGARAVDWAAKNCDNLLIGRFLGARSLGAYSIAFNVVVTPAKRISIPVAQVFFPAFSRMRDPARIAETWLRALRMVALVVIPGLLGVLAIAPDFVRILFGPRWHAAAGVLQLLAIVGLAQALTSLNFGVLQAVDAPQVLFRYTMLASAATVAAFAVGLIWGLTGVAAAYLIVEGALEPLFVVLTTRRVSLSPWRWLRSVAGVLQAGAGMLAAVLLLRAVLLRAHAPLGARFGACIVVGALVYVALLAWRAPEIRMELRVLRERARSVPAPAQPAESLAEDWHPEPQPMRD